jgi:hypothetical protein
MALKYIDFELKIKHAFAGLHCQAHLKRFLNRLSKPVTRLSLIGYPDH